MKDLLSTWVVGIGLWGGGAGGVQGYNRELHLKSDPDDVLKREIDNKISNIK